MDKEETYIVRGIIRHTNKSDTPYTIMTEATSPSMAMTHAMAIFIGHSMEIVAVFKKVL